MRKSDDFAPLGLRIFDGHSIHRALPYAIDIRALPYAQENHSSIKAESLAINSIGQRPMNRNKRESEAPQGRNQLYEHNIKN